MTPEQENELVARWMGYQVRAAHDGTTRWIPPNAPRDPWIAIYPITPPPYRTDPALLWQLMERLNAARWQVTPCLGAGTWTILSGTYTNVHGKTLAEAVFAAAVVQAQEDA